MKKLEHHFLKFTDKGILSLFAIGGQTIKGEKLSPDVVVKGCEKYRNKFPVGSVFGTTSLKRVYWRSSSFFEVEDLYFLGENDPFQNILTEPLRQELIVEYKLFRDDTEKKAG